MRRLGPLLLAALLLAACGDDEPPRAAATAPPTAATAAPTATPEPEQPPGRSVRFRSEDGKRLRGRLTPAGRGVAPAIVLTHQLNGGPDQFDPLIPVLHEAGFTTLAYASRRPDEVDEAKLARDVAGAVGFLRSSGRADSVGLVGASIGGTTVAYVLGTMPELDLTGGVGLSAVSSYDIGDLERFRPHDLLLITDEREAYDAETLTQDAGGEGVTTMVARSSGHGVVLLDDPRVVRRLVAWLSARA